MSPEQRVARFKRLLQQQARERFKHVCFVEGVPDDGSETASLRAISWKLLLGYLPPERSQWQPVLAEQRRAYKNFCVELTVDPQAASLGSSSNSSSTSTSTRGAPPPPPPLTPSSADMPDGNGDVVETDPLTPVAPLSGDSLSRDPLSSDLLSGDPLSGGPLSGDPLSDGLPSPGPMPPKMTVHTPSAAVVLDDADHPLTAAEGSQWLAWHADEDLRSASPWPSAHHRLDRPRKLGTPSLILSLMPTPTQARNSQGRRPHPPRLLLL